MFALTTTSKIRPINPAALSFTSPQMAYLGAFSIERIQGRVARGVGSDDAPMKPLRPWYARYKGSKGLPQIRDLRGPGNGPHMLDNISVRTVTDSSVRVDITSQAARLKAAANERRASWYGFSPSDATAILEEAQSMAHGNIQEVTAERGLSIWIDPRRLKSIGYRTKEL